MSSSLSNEIIEETNESKSEIRDDDVDGHDEGEKRNDLHVDDCLTQEVISHSKKGDEEDREHNEEKDKKDDEIPVKGNQRVMCLLITNNRHLLFCFF